MEINALEVVILHSSKDGFHIKPVEELKIETDDIHYLKPTVFEYKNMPVYYVVLGSKGFKLATRELNAVAKEFF